MTQFRLILIISIFTLYSCKNNSDGYFNEMPERFNVDSLTKLTGLFNSIKIQKSDNGNKIRLSSNDCALIPFCGTIWFSQDTIYIQNEQLEPSPFLILNKSKNSQWSISYSPERTDEVTYLGTVPDNNSGGNLELFMLTPIIRKAPLDASYLKYILVRQGGIKYLGFWSYPGEFTISLNKYPQAIKN